MTESEKNDFIKKFTDNITVDKDMPHYEDGPNALKLLEEARVFLEKHPIPQSPKREIKK